VLALAYALLIMSGIGWLVSLAGYSPGFELTPELRVILALNFGSFA
jgi:hypothetical protein